MSHNQARAAVDIGSNTVQMLAVRRKPGGLEPVCRYLATTRLGRMPGYLEEGAISDTLKALAEIKKVLADCQIREILLVGTSALREAANSRALLAGIESELGWQVEIISPLEEARLAYAGAMAQIGRSPGLILDIGGGSTEISHENGAFISRSFPLGARRLQQLALSREEIQDIFRGQGPLPALSGKTLIGVGGTITAAAALKLGLAEYAEKAIAGTVLKDEDIRSLLAALAPLSPEERCLYAPLLAQRGEIIQEGLLILEAVMALLGAEEILTSTAGILEGILLERF